MQYMSDLHLEKAPGFRIHEADVVAKRLILAGDIGDPCSTEYARFMADCGDKFEDVFVVLGNHECFGRTVDEAELAARSATSDSSNVHVLSREGVDVESTKLRVIGTTLWSEIPTQSAFQVSCCVTDFSAIKKWSVSACNARHRADVAWIRREVNEAVLCGKRIVLVTHHAPLTRGTSAPRFDGCALNVAFATDLSEMMSAPPIVAWIHGHTHFSNAQRVNGVLVASNQRGYPGENDVSFDPKARIDIDA